MIENKKIIAVIIGDANHKEYDKLFTLFTREYGKIKAYAFGVRRPYSKKIGILRLFSFCNLTLRVNEESYSIVDAEIIKNFDELVNDYNSMCYASYFIELIDYFGYENIESSDIFELLYYSFKALKDKKIDNDLISLIFKLKLLKYQGIYIESDMLKYDNKTLKYVWDFILTTIPKKLYSFNLDNNIYTLFKKEVEYEFNSNVDAKFKSLNQLI